METHEARSRVPSETERQVQHEDGLVFMNYTHPSHLLDKERRKSFHSVKNRAHNRYLRQKNLRQAHVLQWTSTGRGPFPVNAWAQAQDSQQAQFIVRNSSESRTKWPVATLNHSFGGLRTDLFRTFRIPVHGCVAHAVDYFKDDYHPGATASHPVSIPH
jgi:hypothetical protein